MKEQNRLNVKGLISFLITLIMLILLSSGIVLYIAPQCKIAGWINWRVLGLTKDNWEAVHKIFALLFFILICVHLYLNWNIFLKYFRTKLTTAWRLSKEFIIAIVLIVAIFSAVLLGVPPFSWIVDYGERQKLSWAERTAPPPFPKAELATIKQLSKRSGRSAEEILGVLNKHGIHVKSRTLKIEQIAVSNDLSPKAVYQILSASKKSIDFKVESRLGYGKKSITEICEEFNVSVGAALERLSKRGIKAHKGMKLKHISSEYFLSPMEVVNIIRGKNDCIK